MPRRRTSLVLLVLLLAGFGFSLVRLFLLRFERGDVYPAYSSLRSDPLGTRALFEALARVPGVAAGRSYDPSLRELGRARGETVLLLGVPGLELSLARAEEFREYERFLAGGGRLVIALFPQTKNPWFERARAARTEERAGTKKNGSRPDTRARRGRAPDGDERRNLSKGPSQRWGVTLRYHDLPQDADGQVVGVANSRLTNAALPGTIPWHSGVTFDRLAPAWSTVYARGDSPVVIERTWGKGTLVLSSDSYFLSNEAMFRERQPELLSWLVGPSAKVLFDETHFGVRENPGVMMLARRYGLEGVLAAVALLLALFIWKNGSSFLPKEETGAGDGAAVAGRDSFAGLVNLLRRGIPPPQLLDACVLEWQKSAAPKSPAEAARLEQMRQVAGRAAEARSETARLAAYRSLCRLVNPRRFERGRTT